MANPHRGEVAVRLHTPEKPDGAPYTLRPEFEAFATIEAETGCAIRDLAARIDRGSLPVVKVALRELLKAAGTPVNDDAVIAMINHTGLGLLIDPAGYLPRCIASFFTGGRAAQPRSGESKTSRRKSTRGAASKA